MTATVTINGKSFICGRNIKISDGVLISDGETLHDFGDEKKLVIENIYGEVNKLELHCATTINGDVKGNILAKGPVNCGDIGGKLQ